MALTPYSLVVLDVKATDLCGHDGKASEKIRVIERMDTMMGHLKSKLSSDVVVAITADHSTPVAVKDHSGDPVPLTISGKASVGTACLTSATGTLPQAPWGGSR